MPQGPDSDPRGYRPGPDRSALDLHVERLSATTATVRLVGELDMTTAPHLRDVLDDLLTDGCRTVGVDLAGLTFLAAAGMAVLVNRDTGYRAAGAGLRLVAPTPATLRLLAMTGLDRTLTVRDRPVS